MPVRHGMPEKTYYFHVTSARDQHELIDWISARSEDHALRLLSDQYDDDPTVAITSLGTTPPSKVRVQLIRVH